MTEIITNNAAATLMFSIAINTAKVLNLNYKPFVMSVLVASSCGFAIPFGYATHLMVYNEGKYNMKDFLKIGIPVDLIWWGISSALIPIIWPFDNK